MSIKSRDYRIIICKIRDICGGGYFAYVPELPVCTCNGDTQGIALKNIRNTIKNYIKHLKERNQEIPKPLTYGMINDIDIEKLSEEVHNAWMNEKVKQGFHAPKDCPTIDCPCEFCNADIALYSDLPENVKDFDRVTVKAILDTLKTFYNLPFSTSIDGV